MKVEEPNLSDVNIKQLIRRSLVGDAAEAVVSLPPSATSAEILTELCDLYGAVSSKVDGWSRFYAAAQSSTESVADWKRRLLTLFDEANYPDKFSQHRDDMLCKAFWQNLYNKDLRIATSAYRDKPFNELFRYTRENEALYATKPPTKPVKAAILPEVELLQKEMEALRTDNKELRTLVQQAGAKSTVTKPRFVPTCFGCGVEGHTVRGCPNRNKQPAKQHNKQQGGKPKKKCEFCFREGHTQESCFVFQHHKKQGNIPGWP